MWRPRHTDATSILVTQRVWSPCKLSWHVGGASAAQRRGVLLSEQPAPTTFPQVFRATDGKTLIWGRPPRMIRAQYTTSKGDVKSSLLLASGWWGISRHFHYLPEIMGAFFWTVPAGFYQLQPYFYVIFLTMLLTDRALRDDARCRGKYGKYWEQYCQLVPYKMVPGLY